MFTFFRLKRKQIADKKFFYYRKALSGECGFMAANLYAKSIFGEDALANVSLEKNPAKPDAPVTGIYIFCEIDIFLHIFF